MAEEPERKRQRLGEPEPALIMDVNSPARWDFLAPWCQELKGQLISIPSGFIRVLGPRRKLQKPLRFDWMEEDENEEDKGDPEEEKKEFERSLWRTREAIELLSLVGKVDRQAFHMLVTVRCGLRLDDDESDEEEFRVVMPGDGKNDIVFSDAEESEAEEEEGVDEEQDENEEENDGDRRDQDNSESEDGDDEFEVEDGQEGARDEEDEDDGVLVLPPDTLKSERRRERETLVSPRFDFIASSGYGFPYPAGEDAPKSPVKEQEEFLLAESPLYQPSDEFTKAKLCILQMQNGDCSHLLKSLEIPVSLEFNRFAKTAEELAG